MTRLVGLLRRYGKAIEYDLLTLCRVRLSAEWQARNFRFLLSTIDRLPPHSRFAEAVAQDDDLAEATKDVEPLVAPPALSAWTQEVVELRAVVERLGVVAQLLAVLSKNTYSPPQLPRPVTARERLRLREGQHLHNRVRSILLPDQYPPEEVPDGRIPG